MFFYPFLSYKFPNNFNLVYTICRNLLIFPLQNPYKNVNARVPYAAMYCICFSIKSYKVLC